MTDSGSVGAVPPAGHPTTAVSGFTEAELQRALLARLPDVTVFVFDDRLRYVLVGGAAFSRLGWTEEELLGHSPSELMPPEQAAVLEDHFRAALRGETRQYEHPGIRRSDVYWLSTISPIFGPDGSVVAGTVVSRDVAEIRRLEEAGLLLEVSASALSERAEAEGELRERLEFLNEINRVLESTVDRRDVMRAVTTAAVPRLGDWCSIHVFFEHGAGVPEVEVAHVDPAMVEYARELQERFPYDPDAPAGVPAVVRNRESEFVAEITEEMLAGSDLPEGALDIVRNLKLSSVITVPLIKWDRVVGAMQFVLEGTNRRYDQDDLTLAEAMAGRVASSLENHRLTELQKGIAETLQRSLLPAMLPDIPGVGCAVAYQAAGEVNEVGGDLYDVFEIDDGRFGIVIGDVCGKEPHAAALTSLIRHSVRANAWRGDRPAEVLAHVNDAVRRTEDAKFCTLVYGELTCRPDGIALTIANGGHPTPIVLPAGGEPRKMDRLGPLVGVLDEPHFEEGTIEVDRGDTIVLYTDGVPDLPPPDGLDDAELLRTVTAAVRESDGAEGVVASLTARLEQLKPFSTRHDDVALLVLQVRPA
jgi:PAS domain S-box-containing protein